MRFFILLLMISAWKISSAQLSFPDTINDQPLINSNSTNGVLTVYYSNGNKKFEANKRKENLHGAWSSWYENGRLLDSGYFCKSIPDGIWKGYYKNGGTQFLRTYSADKWQRFQNEKTLYHPKRVSMPLIQLYHENKKQANKYIRSLNSFCARQNCNRGKEELRQIVDNNNLHNHYHPSFENGLLHGVFANYFPDGALKDSGNYRDGLPEGLWIKWTDDKQFYWQGYYQHGRKNKEWKLYTSTNKLIRIVSYRQGRYLWRKDMKEDILVTEEEMTGF